MKAIQKISEYFGFEKYGTSYRTEIISGISTFLALSYIFVVNPSILGQAGFDKSAVLFATIITSFLSTLAMGLWANKPFAVAPGMELNAYVAFFVVLGLGFTWQEALGAVFWSGVLFMVFTLTNIRARIISSIPEKMKSGLSLCVGVFLMLIALRLAGILIYENIYLKGLGMLLSPAAYVFYFGLALLLILRRLKVPGSVLISIALSSVLAYLLGLSSTETPVRLSKDMLGALFQLDIKVILNPRMWSVILILFLVDFYGSVAKFIGLTRNTSIVSKDGNMPRMKQALSVDGLGTMAGSAMGTTSMVAYVESAVGIAEGGRTGFVAVVISILMLAFLALMPVVNLVPVIATTGALFWVGIALSPSLEELKKYNRLEIATLIVMVLSVIATFAIDRALLFGLIIFIAGALVAKKSEQVNVYLLVSAALLLAGFISSIVFG